MGGGMVASAAGRLPLEPLRPDFPFYRPSEGMLTASGWFLVLAGTVIGFLMLLVPLPLGEGPATAWLRTAAFAGIPLLCLTIAAPTNWRRIFGRVGLRELGLMLLFAMANIVISMVIGALVQTFGTTSGNARIADAGQLSGAALFDFYAQVAVQLLGEELITILPFLALLTFCHRTLNFSRNGAAIFAWLVTAMAFGLIHLSTYQWKFVQCLVVIGGARLILTWAYIHSKSIWVSTGAHIINDWAIMSATIFLAPLVGDGA